MARQLERVRAGLDARERDRVLDRQRSREQQLGEQFGFRGTLTWFVCVAGVGHGSREGTRAIPEGPEVHRGIDKG